MKKVISISVDEALLNTINPKNTSKYFNELLRNDVVLQEQGSLTKQLKDFLLEDEGFNDYITNIAIQEAETAIRKAQQGQY